MILLIYIKNLVLTETSEKIFKKFLIAFPISLLALILDLNDLIDLDEENNIKLIKQIWCKNKFKF